MKNKICFIGILFISINIYAQSLEKLPGFSGLEWGKRLNDSKIYFLQKNGYSLSYEDKDILILSGDFGGKAADVVLSFYLDQFYCGSVLYFHSTNMALREYNESINQLIKKYGPATYKREEYAFPYHSGDGYEEDALRVNKATVGSVWQFNDGNRIISSINNETLRTMILYIDDEIANKKQISDDNVNSSDF